jgi:hypothetical protein
MVAVVAVVGLGATGCFVAVRPAGPGLYYVSHHHVHDEYCGHYRVWYGGTWVYYYDGRWEYYDGGRGWVYYNRDYVPAELHTHYAAAKVYRAPAGHAYGKGGSPGHAYGATKAAPDESPGYKSSGPSYGASKAAPDAGPSYGASKASPDPGPSYGASKASPGPGPGPSGKGSSGPSYGATKAAPKKDDKGKGK